VAIDLGIDPATPEGRETANERAPSDGGGATEPVRGVGRAHGPDQCAHEQDQRERERKSRQEQRDVETAGVLRGILGDLIRRLAYMST
jgi:hypothetical protein